MKCVLARWRGTCLLRLPRQLPCPYSVSAVGGAPFRRHYPRTAHAGECALTCAGRSGRRDLSASARHMSLLLNSNETVFALSSGHGKCGKVSACGRGSSNVKTIAIALAKVPVESCL